MRTIEVTARKLAKNCRRWMRDCALLHRKALKNQDVEFTETWLKYAKKYRDLSREYLEAA